MKDYLFLTSIHRSFTVTVIDLCKPFTVPHVDHGNYIRKDLVYSLECFQDLLLLNNVQLFLVLLKFVEDLQFLVCRLFLLSGFSFLQIEGHIADVEFFSRVSDEAINEGS